jgi:peptide/nickel transport system substrate-binding protein
MTLLGTLILIFSLAACSGGGNAPAGGAAAGGAATSTPPAAAGSVSKTPADTLVIAGSEIWQATFSPLNHTSTSMLHAEAIALDHLLKMNEATQTVEPWLATEWSYDEAKTTLTVKLREGVKFHDGTDFTAEDAAASCVAYSAAANVSGSWWPDELTCAVIDDYSFTITPKSGKPMGALVNMLTATPVMSADDLANPTQTLDRGYNGTGPYKFVKLENETAYYDAFPECWSGAPQMPHIAYQYVGDSQTRLNTLLAGEVDVIERADSDAVAVMESDPNINVVTFITTENKHLIPKFQKEPMNNALLRRAIAYAIDYDGIVNSIMGGYAGKVDSFVSSRIWGHAAVPGVGEYNPDLARQLLAEAGYPNGEGLPEIEITTSVGFYPKTKEYYEYIVANLAEVGIPAKCTPMDASAWGDILYDPQPAFYATDCGWQPSGIEPELKLSSWYYHGRISHYEPTAELLDVMKRFAQETDDAARRSILQNEYLPALAAEMPDIPLLQSMAIYGVRNNVKGLDFTAGADFILANVTKD